MIDITGSSDALGPTPISVEGPARDGPYFLRGHGIQAEGRELDGLQVVTDGNALMMTGCASSLGPASHVRLDPGLMTRNWSDGGEERTWAALTVPLLVWEYSGPRTGSLEWRIPVGAGGAIEHADPGNVMLVHERGGRNLFVAYNGVLSAQLQDGLAHCRLEHPGSARLVAAALADEAGERRITDHLTRRGITGLATQRAQHYAHLGKLGTRLRTPEETVDRAFSWAAILCEEAAGRGALDSPGGDVVVQGIRAAGLQRTMHATDAPVAPFRMVPVEGALQRLREAGALVDARSATMFGPDPARAAAVLMDGVHGLFGATPAGDDELSLLPSLPAGWPSMALDRLRVGSAALDVEVRRRPHATAISLRVRSGGPVTVSAGLTGVGVAQVDLDDVVMPSARARFEARHDHLLVFRHAD